jgi:hypothetical protein
MGSIFPPLDELEVVADMCASDLELAQLGRARSTSLRLSMMSAHRPRVPPGRPLDVEVLDLVVDSRASGTASASMRTIEEVLRRVGGGEPLLEGVLARLTNPVVIKLTRTP